MTNVDILMSTFNGELYFVSQVESLLKQSCTEWRLIVRDDGSSDSTRELLEGYVSKYPDQIVLDTACPTTLGIVGSYNYLVNLSTARYLAFCDQDDVWDSEKLLLQVEKMKELEEIHGESVPILIHTDLLVVNHEMKLISDSFWKYQNISPDKMSTLPKLLVQNCVTGCTVLINRPLAKLALPFSDGVIMHDWWLALVAASEGLLCGMRATTVQYRQHDSNDTGAKHWSPGFIFKAIFWGRQLQKKNLLKTRAQAEALVSANILSDANREIVEKYIAMYDHGWFVRRLDMIRMGFFKYGLIRNIAMFLRI